MRVSSFVLAALVLVWSTLAHAGTTAGKIVRVTGMKAVISVGADAGVREGSEGEVFYIVEIAAQKKRITVAQFTVSTVSDRTAVIRVFNTSAPVNTGYLIQFKETLHPRVVAQPAKGVVYVSSEPDGATVVVNGKEHAAVTPVTIEGIPVGEARIELRKDYYVGTVLVQVVPDRTTNVSVVLEAEPVQVHLESLPPEATVFVDDEQRGATPVDLRDLGAGNHVLRVQKTNFCPAEETILVKDGGKEERTLTLKPCGTLAFSITPKEAKLVLDGMVTECRNGRCELEVDAGDHEVLVADKDSRKYASTVRVEPGANVPVNVALSNSDISKKTIIGWAFSGVGIATLGVSGILLWRMRDLDEQADGLYSAYEVAPTDATYEPVQNKLRAARVSGIAGYTCLGSGVALVGFGLYALLTAPAEASPEFSVVPAVTLSTSGLTVNARW